MSIIKQTTTARYELNGSKNDLNAIIPLLAAQSEEEKRLFAFPELLTHYETSDDTLSKLVDFWASNKNIYSMKAYVDEHCIGFITVQIKGDYYNNQEVAVGEIVAVYVSDAYRRMGIGAELMALAEELLVSKGVHAVNTSWLQGNMASAKLYERSGFTPIMVHARKFPKAR